MLTVFWVVAWILTAILLAAIIYWLVPVAMSAETTKGHWDLVAFGILAIITVVPTWVVIMNIRNTAHNAIIMKYFLAAVIAGWIIAFAFKVGRKCKIQAIKA